jgi:hypothetical protein
VGAVLGSAAGDEVGDTLRYLDGAEEGNCEASTLGDLLGCAVIGR